MNTIYRDVCSFNPESAGVAAGRTGLAIAQLILLVFTPAAYLFVPVAGQKQAPVCDGMRGITAYCFGGSLDPAAVQVLLILGLLLVASGLLPAITSVLHVWLTYSISASIALPDGGEIIAQVATLFIALICINDRRLWHWRKSSRPNPESAALNGVSWAGHWGLRVQVAFVYANSSIAKMSVAAWADGSALYYVTRGSFFGSDNFLTPAVLAVTSWPLGTLALTWGTLLAELLIALFLIIGQRKARLSALALCVLLHVGIILVIGLWTFGIVMISVVTIACSREIDPVIRFVRNRRRSDASTPAVPAIPDMSTAS